MMNNSVGMDEISPLGQKGGKLRNTMVNTQSDILEKTGFLTRD